MKPYDVIVIGGGAAGMTGAIFAKRRGASVLLCEKMPKLGKKLLISGAGRCNLLNEKLDASFYGASARELVARIFEQFGKTAILDFFSELGLPVCSDETGRMFPVTNQAASVLRVLEMELERLEISSALNCAIKNIEKTGTHFSLKTEKGQIFHAKSIMLCGGGKSYPALGSDGNCYAFAEQFGHTLVEPVPGTVSLVAKNSWCHLLQGQKIRATVTSRIQGKDIRTVSGELLFTKYGLSGTAILDVSNEISIAINREHLQDIYVITDLIPFMDEGALVEELSRRFEKGIARSHLLEGLLPSRFFLPLKEILQKADASTIAHLLKHKEFKLQGTRGWNEAEFTTGGIPAVEVKPDTLESKRQRGLFFAGEILDVQGRRGGYNLAWAWASGAVAGNSI